MGRHSYGRPRVHIYPGDRVGVKVGPFCSIGEDVEFLPGGMHNVAWVSTFPFSLVLGFDGTRENPVVIADTEVGADVWIGRSARILAGVAIGHGAVVGAYSVVANAVRPYAIVAGNPAREVRRRFSDDIVAALLELRWWDWPLERLRESSAWLNGAIGDEVRFGLPRAPST